jgi:uncharacterized protein
VPMAFLGAYLLHVLGGTSAQQNNVEIALGAALLVGTAAMVLRYWLDRRSGQQRTAVVESIRVRPVPTVLIGIVGGLIVGMTSVGSGSLMIVLLLFTYPMLSAGRLVGTDLTQAVPLTAAAALGALAFGHVEFGLTAAVIVGSVPAVLIGSLLSSRAPDKYIRPAITFVIFASGLKYVGMGTTALGWTLCGVLLAGGVYWLWANSRKTSAEPAPEPEAEVLRRLPAVAWGRRGPAGQIFRGQSFGTPRRNLPFGPRLTESSGDAGEASPFTRASPRRAACVHVLALWPTGLHLLALWPTGPIPRPRRRCRGASLAFPRKRLAPGRGGVRVAGS